MSLLEEKSLADSDIREQPSAYYHALRDQPLYYDARLGFFICSKYALMRRIVRDTETFSNIDSQTMDGLRPPPAEVRDLRQRMHPQVNTLVTNDPPSHTHYRKLVDNPFTPRHVRQTLRGSIEEIVREAAAPWLARGECEFVSEFATPVPLRVIADQLGVPRADSPKFKLWSDAAVEPLGMMISDERMIECTRLTKAFQDYFEAAIRERQAHPGDDLLSHLATVRDDEGGTLSIPEILSLTSQLLVAGNETTTNALAAGMQLLLDHPEQRRLCLENPKRIRTLSEETLRLESPVQGLFRVVKHDTELNGVPLPAGARIMLRFAAANRDPAQYGEPDGLDVCRANAGTHLAFGAGIHHCLGAALAREEMNAAFEYLLPRMEAPHFLAGNDFTHQPSLLLRGLKRLRIGFTPRS